MGLYWLTLSVLKIKCCVGELQQMEKGACTIQHLKDYKDYDSKHNLCHNAAIKAPILLKKITIFDNKPYEQLILKMCSFAYKG